MVPAKWFKSLFLCGAMILHSGMTATQSILSLEPGRKNGNVDLSSPGSYELTYYIDATNHNILLYNNKW